MTGQVKMCKNGVNLKLRYLRLTITGLTITEKIRNFHDYT
jgi:hypothetical protein